ncbi:sensor domain-containing diguanylate cyclase [Granulicella pectinivorans]|jgi:diguanylate cyclase (GGDEF)-like protein|nr:diguanylate cyclase [Granulicella pectinivorans]
MTIGKPTRPGSPIALIIAAAVASLLFTAGAGVFLYRTTQSLITSSSWVQHTQDVLNALQSANIQIERVGNASRLFTLTKDDDQLNAARSNANALSTAVVRLRSLVVDNKDQTANVEALEQCSIELTHQLDKLKTDLIIPREQMLSCRQTVNIMSDQERRLLKTRNELSEKNSYLSVTEEVAFVGLSLVGLIILFTFLLRDAFDRRKVTSQTEAVNLELAQSVKSLEDRAHETRILTNARNELQLCVDVDQLYRAAVASLGHLIPGTAGSLCMINNSRHLVESVGSWGTEVATARLPEVFATQTCCGLRAGSPRWRRPGLSEIHCDHFSGAAPEVYLCIPMVAQGETIGFLYTEAPTPAAVVLIEQRLEGIRQLLQLTGMAIASLQLRTKLENQSIRDALTGLFNRHFMQIALERELALAQRRQNQLAVMMLDVDHFKRFNDRFGHPAGDAVLKAVAAVFQASIRAEDIACRYGGEEFSIILPDVTPLGALERAETIRAAIANLNWGPDTSSGDITISIGVAMYPADGTDGEYLLRVADQALYRAKHAGRNQVIMAEPALNTVTKPLHQEVSAD